MKNRIFMYTLYFILFSSALIVGGNKKAKIFAKNVISTGKDYCTSFTPDGKTVFFAREDTVSKKDMIMKSQWRDGKWLTPKVVEFSGKYDDTDPYVTHDGLKMFFMSKRPIQGSTPKKEYDIWYVERQNKYWSEPQHLGNEINTNKSIEGFPSLTKNGYLYFFSDHEGGYGKADIYRSKYVNGKYAKGENLGSTINTEHWDGHAYVTPDEKVMILYSNKPGGYGKGDLYVSYNNNDNWSKPENLGPMVNTKEYEITPSISPDGKYLFFSRIFGDVAKGRRDIFYIEIKETPINY